MTPRFLTKILIDIKRVVEPIYKNQQTQNNQRELPLPVVVHSELGLPVVVREHYEAKERERQSLWTRKVKPGLKVASVVVSAVLAAFTFLTLLQIKKQAAAAQKQLEVTDRPWLGVNPVVKIDRITVSKQGIGADLVIPVKNWGASPAIEAKAGALVVTSNMAPNGEKLFWNQSDIACITAEGPPMSDRNRGAVGAVVFPGITISYPHTLSAGGGGALDPESMLEIIGCIVYKSPAGGKAHHTRFCFESRVSAGDFKVGDTLFSCEFGNTAD